MILYGKDQFGNTTTVGVHSLSTSCNFIRVPIPLFYLQEMMKTGRKFNFKIVRGIPEGAIYCGMQIDPSDLTLYMYYKIGDVPEGMCAMNWPLTIEDISGVEYI